MRTLRFVLASLFTLCLLSGKLSAQTNVDGAIVGFVPSAGTVVAESVATGAVRTVTPSSAGSFRISALPPGVYRLTYTDVNGVESTRTTSVSINTTSNVDFAQDLEVLDEFQVGRTFINPINFETSESQTLLNADQVDDLPISRDLTSTVLLAPGTTQGDTAFGNLASFGGASVAENAYFINGMNLSNFRNGLSPARVPFEFYDQFEVKTGAYSAEFGRSTGGVINATSKSGTNEFKFGGNAYYLLGTEKRPDATYFDPDTGEEEPYIINRFDDDFDLEYNFYGSGPILEDKFFFYFLYNMRDQEFDDVISRGSEYQIGQNDDPFLALKLDFIPFDGHRLEYTGFRDARTGFYQIFPFDLDAEEADFDADPRLEFADRGGNTHSIRYTGAITDNFTVSAMWGRSSQARTDRSTADADDLVIDVRSGSPTFGEVLSGAAIIASQASDEREAFRVDLEYVFEFAGQHRLRVGYDSEDNTSLAKDSYTGGGDYWRLVDAVAGSTYGGEVVPDGVDELARYRYYANEGSFDVLSEAIYLEDNWTLMDDRLVLRLGVRNEAFENLNSLGETFIKIDDQIAPRLGFSYDLFGDNKTKLFANYGRYHLPVASNTNVRLAGGERFIEEWYPLLSLDANNIPVTGDQIGTTSVYSDGSVKDRATIVDLDIDPMYQDEFVIGAQQAIGDSYSIGVRGIMRTMESYMDDMIVDHALYEYAKANGLTDSDTFLGSEFDGLFHYVLGNPAKDMRTAWDFEDDGVDEEIILTAEWLDYPEASRDYYAVEIFGEKVWDGKWAAQFSYTWSQSYGNTEGLVLSDNGQDDAGLTILYDTPDLMRNTYGPLANDRRHTFKLFGTYQLADTVKLGANALIRSGRPINAFGGYDDSVIGTAYGTDYLIEPRGSVGRTDWVYAFDLSLRWTPAFFDNKMIIGFDVFNILDGDAVTEVYEYKYESDVITAEPSDPIYLTPTSWQTPRYYRISVSYTY